MTPESRQGNIEPGTRVRVRRGAMVKRFGPDWPVKTEPSKRAQTVRIHCTTWEGEVEWIGAGGYSRAVAESDVEPV